MDCGIYFFLLLLTCHITGSGLDCPSDGHRVILAVHKCGEEKRYVCLFNVLKKQFEENCLGPQEIAMGYKLVLQPNLHNSKCDANRFQPFNFLTNASSNCVFLKSKCNEEGQLLIGDGNSSEDTVCRCDHRRGYRYIYYPKNPCACLPLVEDCSCYRPDCLFVTSVCTGDMHFNTLTNCPDIEKEQFTPKRNYLQLTEYNNKIHNLKKREGNLSCFWCIVAAVLVCLIVECVYILINVSRKADSEVMKSDIETNLEKRVQSPSIQEPAMMTIKNEQKLPENTVTSSIQEKQTKQRRSCCLENEKEIREQIRQAVTKEIDRLIANPFDELKEAKAIIGITGAAGVGKSTFINFIRNVSPANPDFAEEGSGNTTTKPKEYSHPKNDKIVFFDLPGFAQIGKSREDYIKEMVFRIPDIVFIFYEHNISENELWIVQNLLDLRISFCFVRSKIDSCMKLAKRNGKSVNCLIEQIRAKAEEQIFKNEKLRKCKALYLISSYKPELGDMKDLANFIETKFLTTKTESLMYKMSCTSQQLISEKYNNLFKGLPKITVDCIKFTATPEQGNDVSINSPVFAAEIKHFLYMFGLDEEKVTHIKGFDFKRLKCSSLLSPGEVVPNKVIEKMATQNLDDFEQKFFDLCLPLPINVSVTSWLVFTKLLWYLNAIRDDAIIVSQHILHQMK